VADELERTTGEPFDVHGAVRGEVYLTGREMNNPNKRWLEEIRPRRTAILRPLEAFRAQGHKSLEARAVVKPTGAERPHWIWNLPHLTELCVISQIELSDEDAVGETEISIMEAPGPECPRCWRRTGGVYRAPAADGAALLCERCCNVVDSLPPA
jgi:hypothetical protein